MKKYLYVWVNQKMKKSTKIWSAGAKPKRKERSFSTQLSLKKSPAVEINCPERNGPEWFMHKDSLWFSHRAGFRERERESIYRCMFAVLILTLFSFGLFSFFPSHLFLFYYWVSLFKFLFLS